MTAEIVGRERGGSKSERVRKGEKEREGGRERKREIYIYI